MPLSDHSPVHRVVLAARALGPITPDLRGRYSHHEWRSASSGFAPVPSQVNIDPIDTRSTGYTYSTRSRLASFASKADKVILVRESSAFNHERSCTITPDVSANCSVRLLTRRAVV